MAKIIGLCGYRRSGKDFVADYLVKKFGFHKMKFANRLYEMGFRSVGIKEDPTSAEAQEAFKVKKHRLELDSGQSPDIYGRDLLIFLSDFVKDNIGKDYFINSTITKTMELNRAGQDVVISDVRFEEEAKLIKSLGGEIFRVKNPEITEPPSQHSSETEVDKIVPTVVLNNVPGTKQILQALDILLATTGPVV